MTDLLEHRLRAAAEQAMEAVTLEHPSRADVPDSAPGRRRRWVTAAALTAAATVVAIAAWGVLGSGTAEAPQPVEPAPNLQGDPISEVRAAVAETNDAPAWTATVDTGARMGTAQWTYQAPDRLRVVGEAGVGEPGSSARTCGSGKEDSPPSASRSTAASASHARR